MTTMEAHEIILAIAEMMNRSLTITLERIANKSTEGLHPEVIIPISLSRFVYKQLTVVALCKGIAPHELKDAFIALLRDCMDKDPENIIALYNAKNSPISEQGATDAKS